MKSADTGNVPARFNVGDRVRVRDLPNLFYTRTRSPTLKRAGTFPVSALFIAGPHLCNLFEQLGQRDVVLVDQHSGGGPNPASVVREAVVERLTQIVVAPATPFLGIPHAPPSEHLAGHIGV